MERITEYAHKCKILRQIQSNKALLFARINAVQNIATVVVSSFLTFIGFSGIDKIHTYLNWIIMVDKPKVEFLFNFLVFILFVLVILHLVFRFGHKQSEAERAVVSLSSLLNQIEDILTRTERGEEIKIAEHELVRQKYEMIIQVIPPNSDKEFLKAKIDFQDKEAKQVTLQIGPFELFDADRQKIIIETLVRKSTQIMSILETLRRIDERLFCGGGIIRNIVWDYLHGYKTSTPIEDIDVVYFDHLSATKEHDIRIEEKLNKAVPNFKWSVKNQARMHSTNSDEPYKSFEEAISKWPETATAIAARIFNDGRLDIVAPHGYSDLFRLLVVPTPHFTKHIDKYRKRIIVKNWIQTWPKLRVLGLEQ